MTDRHNSLLACMNDNINTFNLSPDVDSYDNNIRVQINGQKTEIQSIWGSLTKSPITDHPKERFTKPLVSAVKIIRIPILY